MRMKKVYTKGFVFVMALVYTLILGLLAAFWMRIASTELTQARRSLDFTRRMYHAESGIEYAMFYFSQYFYTNLAEPPDPPAAGSITGVINTTDGFTISYSVKKQGALKTVLDADTGTTTFVQDFLISSTANSPDGATYTTSEISAGLKNYVFQYAVFYEDDLEILPGQDMMFEGRVHSNGNIYLAADGAGKTLTIDSTYLRSAQEIFGYRKNNGQYLDGDVLIRVKGGGFSAMRDGSGVTLDCSQSGWEADSQARWNGTVKTSVHGVTPLAHPLVGSIAPGGFYENNAGIIVTCSADTGAVLVQKNIAGGLVELYEGTDFPAGTFTVIDGTDTSGTPFFRNQREGKFIYMLDMDMKKLAGYDGTEAPGAPANFPNILPNNGLLYTTITNVPVSMQGGARLYNGDTIYCKTETVGGVTKDVGLTIVTNMPVYIKGDYNKDDAAAGFVKKPCAVIGDAVNILSNDWNDANCMGGSADRVANETEINSAFLGGVIPTAGGVYNGGLENYPRLHENWSGVTLHIKGSFVELWPNQIATGTWIYGTSGGVFYYNAPVRDWHYDTDFNDTSKQPPFTPFVYSTEKILWWS